MLTPQQEQMLAYQAKLEEQSQISPELMGALTALGTGSVGVIAGRAGNAAENLGRKVIGKKPMGGLRRLKRPAGLGLITALLGGAGGYALQNQINSTVPAAEAIAKAGMGSPLNYRDRQLLSGALAQAYSNQGQMLNSGII